MTRRRLPAPPLVLQPILARVRQGSSRAPHVLALADFLHTRGLLTDGGALSLRNRLEGRNGALSLTTQDVRASAHGLVLELLAEPDPEAWPEMARKYYQRYDRGKPRRPTRLQRLFVDWSADLGASGFIEACRSHPHLWDLARQALAYPNEDDPQRRLIEVALAVRAAQSWEPWLGAFGQESVPRGLLLGILPLLDFPALKERVRWLDHQARALQGGIEEDLLLACRFGDEPPLALPASLADLCLHLVESHPGECDPRWLASLRGYRWRVCQLQRLREVLRPEDPVHGIVFGARPGRPWLKGLLDELETLATP